MSSLPPADEMFRDEPLYRAFNIDYETDRNWVKSLRYFVGTLDAYCVQCRANSIFQVENNLSPSANVYANFTVYDHVFTPILSCSRNAEHHFIATFLIQAGTLTKIGQYPSIADLNAVVIEKYRKVLGSSFYAELNKAVGLYSHGLTTVHISRVVIWRPALEA